MLLKVIATGSAGNAYVLEAGGENLLLDAGVHVREIMRMVEHPEKLTGCLITHEHMDHFKSAKYMVFRGIPTYASKGTWKAGNMEVAISSTQRTARAGDVLTLGGFSILPFATQHDAAEPLGYLVRYEPTGETLLYATDTYYLHNTFPKVHYWLIECNYCDDVLDDALYEGSLPLAFRKRLKTSHMSLSRLVEVLKANDLSSTHTVVLCHMSDGRSDEARMVKEVEAASGVTTLAARAGDCIPLDLCPF